MLRIMMGKATRGQWSTDDACSSYGQAVWRWSGRPPEPGETLIAADGPPHQRLALRVLYTAAGVITCVVDDEQSSHQGMPLSIPIGPCGYLHRADGCHLDELIQGYWPEPTASRDTVPLDGTEKQVAWASDLRARALRCVHLYVSDVIRQCMATAERNPKLADQLPGHIHQQRAQGDQVCALLARVSSARWWIDHNPDLDNPYNRTDDIGFGAAYCRAIAQEATSHA